MTPLRIALVASCRHPISEPFAGGLEAHTWALADRLTRRGHQVSLFAAPGSDARLTAHELDVAVAHISDAAQLDTSMAAPRWLAEHHAYLDLMLGLADDGHDRFDVVHNNSLHHLPVAMARTVSVPFLTTLHTPPTPWLESAIALRASPTVFTAVSAHTAAAWRHIIPDAQVVLNGVDLSRWTSGAGGGPLVWSGRLVAEKGPDLAIRAARLAGVALQLVGPVSDPAWFAAEVRPLLGDGIEYLGHRSRADLAGIVGRASAALVTPRWNEPYGLVAAESLACGTPVLGFDRGGLPEVVDDSCAILVGPDDVDGLARAIGRRHLLDRGAARRRAEAACSLDRMVDEYERIYRGLAVPAAA